MRRIWAQEDDDMAEGLIAGKAALEEVVENAKWRLAIHRLLILIGPGSLAFDRGPLAYVYIKNNGQHGCQY